MSLVDRVAEWGKSCIEQSRQERISLGHERQLQRH